MRIANSAASHCVVIYQNTFYFCWNQTQATTCPQIYVRRKYMHDEIHQRISHIHFSLLLCNLIFLWKNKILWLGNPQLMGKSFRSWKDCVICSKQRRACKKTNSSSQNWNAYRNENKHGNIRACPHVMRKHISLYKLDGWSILRAKLYIINIINYWYAIVLNRKCTVIQRKWRRSAYSVPDGIMFSLDLRAFKNEFW